MGMGKGEEVRKPKDNESKGFLETGKKILPDFMRRNRKATKEIKFPKVPESSKGN